MATPVQVPRIDPVSPEVFDRDYVRTGTPVVFRGIIADWSAAGWDFQAWAERWPARSVTVDEYPSGDPFDIVGQRSVSMALPDLARRVTPDGASAARAPVLCCNAQQELPELLREYPPPAMLGARKLDWILFGGRDPVIPGHYHSRNNVLNCQIRGKKRGVLYPPADTRRLYPHPVHSVHYNVSRVNLLAPDPEKFPRFKHARCHEVFLEPGDALFIPVHWWHATYGEGLAMSAALAWTARLSEHRFPEPGVRNYVATALLKSQARWRSVTARIRSLA